jgi:hypothetical protein
LEQKTAEDEEAISRQTLIDNAKKAQAARAEQEALNKRATDFYLLSGQNPLAPIGNSPVIDRIPKYPSALAKDPFWSQAGLDPSLVPQQYKPLNSTSMFTTNHLSTDNFLQYCPARSLNYSEDPFVHHPLHGRRCSSCKVEKSLSELLISFTSDISFVISKFAADYSSSN